MRLSTTLFSDRSMTFAAVPPFTAARPLARSTVLLASILLAACQRGPSAGSQAPTVAQKRAAASSAGPQSPAEQTAGMVEAPVQGKSQAPIGLKFDLTARPLVGQPLTLDLALLAQAPATEVRVQVKGSDGLDVPAEEQQFAVDSIDPQQVYRHAVHLTPTAEGVQLVYLTVSLKHDELSDSRAFTVPLVVSESPAAAAPAAAKPAAPASGGS